MGVFSEFHTNRKKVIYSFIIHSLVIARVKGEGTGGKGIALSMIEVRLVVWG